MPYIVTTRTPVKIYHGRDRAREHANRILGSFELGPQGFVVFEDAQRADATLGEMRERIATPYRDDMTPAEVMTLADAAVRVSEGGGEIRMPDGTVIDVRRETAYYIREWLCELRGRRVHWGEPDWRLDEPGMTADLVAAFNAAQEG